MSLRIGVICYPTLGGSGIIATELGKMMAKRGHTVHFISSDEPFRYEKNQPRLHFHKVAIEHYAVFKYPPYDIALANKIAQVIEEESLDLLHVHYAVPHAIAAALGKDMANSDIPMVTTLHGTDVTILGRDAHLRDTVRYGIEKSTAVTAVSDALKEETYHYIQPKKEIETIYNFIDEEAYYVDHSSDAQLRETFGIAPDEKVCIHISNFRRVKRIDYIVDSFRVVRSFEKAKLLLVGEGPEKEAIERQVRLLGLEDDVIFAGKRKDLRELLSMSDLMFHLSDKEAFGLVILEALATGIPVVATDIGGIPEVVQHGENGYLVPLDDPELVAAYALDLLQSEEKRQQFSMRALQTAEQFSSKEIVDTYEALYRRVMKR